jgi:fructoselysine-6-P-deglycase FrlB-like protein
MGNKKTALAAISSDPVKHGMAQIINRIRGIFVQAVSADGRKGHKKMIRNQQVVRSIRIAGSIFQKQKAVSLSTDASQSCGCSGAG